MTSHPYRKRSRFISSVVIVMLVLAACTSSGDEDRTPIRDRIEYAGFQSKMNRFALDERGPNGEELDLYYIAQGDPESPAVVLIHGVPSSSWMYRYVIEELTNEEIYLLAVDNLGYGASAKPQMSESDAAVFYSPARQAQRLGYLLDELIIDSATFVVHDVGGPILWQLLPERPDLVSGLVVLNTIGAPGGFAPPRAMDNPIVQAGMRLVGFERDESIRNIVCAMVDDREEFDTPVQLEGYYQPFRDGSALPYISFLTNLDIVRDRLETYSRLIEDLDVPSAVFWGAQDENLLADPSAAWFAAALATPDARRVIVDDAKHLVAEEEPGAIARLIRAVVSES